MALGALSRSQVTTWMPVTCEAITDSAALPCRLKPEAIGKPLPLLTFRLSEDGTPLSFPFSDLLLDNATYAHGSVGQCWTQANLFDTLGLTILCRSCSAGSACERSPICRRTMPIRLTAAGLLWCSDRWPCNGSPWWPTGQTTAWALPPSLRGRPPRVRAVSHAGPPNPHLYVSLTRKTDLVACNVLSSGRTVCRQCAKQVPASGNVLWGTAANYARPSPSTAPTRWAHGRRRRNVAIA